MCRALCGSVCDGVLGSSAWGYGTPQHQEGDVILLLLAFSNEGVELLLRKSPSIADPVLRKLAEADRSLSGKSRIRRDWFRGTTRITPPDRWQGADHGIS